MANLFKFLLIGIIVLGLGVGAAFGAGTAYGRGSAPKAATSAATASQGRTGQSTTDSTGAAAFAAAGGRPAAFGTVESVSGNSIAVKTQSGTTTVKTDDKTTIRKTVTGTLDDLTAGTSVVVTGDAGADGSVTATSISINPETMQLRQGGQAGQAQGGQFGQRGQTGGQGGQSPGGSGQ